MNRKDKEIRDPLAMGEILAEAQVCRVGLALGNDPYVVPMSYVYLGGCLYFHGSPRGKKIDLLQKNDRVCFEASVIGGPVPSTCACGWSMRYRSVIGYGKASLVESEAEKREVLAAIVRKYTGRDEGSGAEDIVAKTAVIRIDIDSMTGKQSPASPPKA
ncbi:MAG: Pyridoxamine 5'-phosphate oxidase [Syntrophaceae bacterium PtaU1.Bin231]|nr:MAG: Pyridoxamine 5'-phosphate oxidase [Syntrophaceae bacterium PtaU1.Bin231]